jgi:hypothetical protein
MPKELQCTAGKTARLWLQGKGGGRKPGQAMVLLPPKQGRQKTIQPPTLRDCGKRLSMTIRSCERRRLGSRLSRTQARDRALCHHPCSKLMKQSGPQETMTTGWPAPIRSALPSASAPPLGRPRRGKCARSRLVQCTSASRDCTYPEWAVRPRPFMIPNRSCCRFLLALPT